MFFGIIILAIFFSVNMGGSSFAAAFAGACGGKLISRKLAGFLFIFCVMFGAVTLGDHVSATLGKDIIAPQYLTQQAVLIIFFVAGLSMFIGNLIKIPQSTSLVTVAVIAGAGFAVNSINYSKILYCLFFWIALPVLSFILTWLITSYIYPPRSKNFWVYERYINQRGKLKIFAVLAGCFTAFSVGTNNVANVVGPLMADRTESVVLILLIFAVFYGTGGILFSGPIQTVGEKVVPLGLLTVSIISLVSGSLMIVASVFGVPQSFVMLQMGSLFAVSALKKGAVETWREPLTQRTFYSWMINPLVAFLFSYTLNRIF